MKKYFFYTLFFLVVISNNSFSQDAYRFEGQVKGLKDSLKYAKKLIIDTNVGVAPGIAFGESGEGHLRICFAAQQSFINEIMDRLEPALN